MRRDAVAPVWQGITIIPDEVTKASEGRIVITAILLSRRQDPARRWLRKGASATCLITRKGVSRRSSFAARTAPPGVLSGVAIRYGDRAEIAPGLFERFEARAFGPDVAKSTVVVNRQHERAAPLGRAGGLSFA